MSHPIDAVPSAPRSDASDRRPTVNPDVFTLAARTSVASPTRTVLKDLRGPVAPSLFA